jgi:hypothetical protein
MFENARLWVELLLSPAFSISNCSVPESYRKYTPDYVEHSRCGQEGPSINRNGF